MKAYIEREELLIHPDHDKKIRSALNRINKASEEISDMGYTMYLNGSNVLSVMNVDGAGGYRNNMDYEHDMVVASTSMTGTTGGDW